MFGFKENQNSRIGERWTKEEVILLRKLIDEGEKPEKIANTLRRCDKGVKSKAYSLKLKFGKK